jgi:formylglycine-generating enzyme required for sulfatase activity
VFGQQLRLYVETVKVEEGQKIAFYSKSINQSELNDDDRWVPPSVSADFVCIASGTQHKVTISKSFYISKYEVTQKEWMEVMGSNPSNFKGDKLPVEQVSWFDAVQYCNARSTKEGFSPAYTINRENITWNQDADGYRLPTEAEWEYACRAGTTTLFNTGNGITIKQANYLFTGIDQTLEVGTFPANNWGLHDMHGNVSEWCWDQYAQSAARIIRGGGWSSTDRRLGSNYQGSNEPSWKAHDLGFRVVRSQ